MMKLVYDNITFECRGFYNENIHKDIPKNNVNISKELWEYLLDLENFKFKSKPVKIEYSIEDVELFEVISPQSEQSNDIYSRLNNLEQENANLTFLLMQSGVI